MKRVQEAEAMVAGLVELELASVGKEEGLGSERSTEPERDEKQEEPINSVKGTLLCC
jgi:hypothetical protein